MKSPKRNEWPESIMQVLEMAMQNLNQNTVKQVSESSDLDENSVILGAYCQIHSWL